MKGIQRGQLVNMNQHYCHVTESVSKRGMEKVRPGKAGKASHIKGNSERA